MTILEELDWRGLYADSTDRDALAQRLAAGPLTLYCGFDPTADSLHVGNLVPLLALRRFQAHGHHPIALAGGATGMVGDPSGKSDERNLLTPEQLAHNLECIKPQLARFLDFGRATNPARVVNNYDWTAGVTFLEFLRDIGKHITVNSMIAKDSVRSRMEDRSTGISFTEFSYMLLQAYDYFHLRKTFDCELQVGATDQWGNITVGTELIRKKLGATAWGLVFPLLTKSDGTKYGKTATGTVWLDAKKTSEFKFYQFFANSEDADVIKLLKFLTFLSPGEVTGLEGELKANPGARNAQKTLARELTTLVHGPEMSAAVVGASEKIFGPHSGGIPPEVFPFIVPNVPGKEIDDSFFPHDGKPLVDLLVEANLSASKGQARKDIEMGGISVNGDKEADFHRRVSPKDFVHDQRYLVLKKGKGSNLFIYRRKPV